jgi:hypothetical protein
MEALNPNFGELAGKSLAEVVDSLYAKQAEREIAGEPETAGLVQRWGNQSPSSAYLLPFVGRSFWASFGPPRRRPSIVHSDDPLKVTYKIPREMYEWLFEERLEWFEKATEPFLYALKNSLVSVTGISEPAEKSSWDRHLIPPGFFEVGRWELQRENSRLIALDDTGTPTGVSYIACQLSAPADQPANPGKIQGKESPLDGNILDHNNHKTGFPGRPSMQDWVLQELELRAEKRLLADRLKTECIELLASLKAHRPDAPRYPTEKTISNQIRDRYRQLKGPK